MKPWLPSFLSCPLGTSDSLGLTSGRQTYRLLFLSPVLVRITFLSPFSLHPVLLLPSWLLDRLVCFLWGHMMLLKSFCTLGEEWRCSFFPSWLHWKTHCSPQTCTIQSSFRRETQQVSASTDWVAAHPGTLVIDACLSHRHLEVLWKVRWGVVNSPSWLSSLHVHTI